MPPGRALAAKKTGVVVQEETFSCVTGMVWSGMARATHLDLRPVIRAELAESEESIASALQCV